MIGILGGTFDPVHFGHLRPALEIMEGMKLDEIRLIPCREPPHRGKPLASPEERWAMLQAAVRSEPRFKADNRELRRSGPSYMVDTLTSLQAEFNSTPLCLILGMDAFLGLPTWHRWEAILGLAHIVVATRPRWNVPAAGKVATLVEERRVMDLGGLRERPAGRIYFHAVTQLDISATGIRTLVQAGRSPRYLLPDVVGEMIRLQGLYKCAQD